MTLVFFSPVIPSWISTSRIPKSPEVRFLIVWASTTSLYNSLRLQIPCTFSPPTPHIHSTSGHIGIWNPVGSLWLDFLRQQSICYGNWLFSQRSCIVDVWGSSKCNSVWGEGFLLGLHRKILNSSCSLFLLIHTKYKHNKMKSWTDLTPSFPWRRLIRLTEKAKNVWLIVGQLLIKAGHWDAPLALQDFFQSNCS